MSEPCSLRNRVVLQPIRVAPDHPIQYMKTSSGNCDGRLRDKVFLSALTCTKSPRPEHLMRFAQKSGRLLGCHKVRANCANLGGEVQRLILEQL